MSNIRTDNISCLRGKISIPGDKSISHRAIMISSIAYGRSSIVNLLDGLDCCATADAFRRMGISIEINGDGICIVGGKGLRGLKKPDTELYLGNSGTSMRLLAGILAGQLFDAIITGDASLSSRPMKRIIEPLKMMGARIEGREDANLAPITIRSGSIRSIDYNSPVASAQVKSSIMLAGLYADGITRVTEPYKSRDHTERMLRLFGADIKEEALSVSIKGVGANQLKAQSFIVPGDISSAAFLIALGILAKDADIIIESCGVNPTRIGILKVLERMNANIEIINMKEGFEPTADILVKSSSLKATKITGPEIPALIDEIPVIALCATQAEGKTEIEGIGELRVKETDRVNSIVTSLSACGADIKCQDDTLIVNGPTPLKGACVDSFGDHRTAMMMVIAGAIAKGPIIVNDTDCIATSFPGFMDMLKQLAI